MRVNNILFSIAVLMIISAFQSCEQSVVNTDLLQTTDIYGNKWEIATGVGTVVSVDPYEDKFDNITFDSTSGIPSGEWSMIMADQYGLVWLAGKSGLVLYDPLKIEEGWNEYKADSVYPGGEVTDLKLCFSGRVAVTLKDGKSFEVDVNAKGEKLVKELYTSKCESLGAWKQVAPMPYGAHDVYGAVLDNKIYIPAGAATHGYPVDTHYNFDRMLIYDTESDNWEVTEPMSINRRYCNVGQLDGKIWVVGGYRKVNGKETAVNSVEIYDPVTKKWTEGPALDVPCVESVAGVINNRLYVVVNVEGELESKVFSISSGDEIWMQETSLPYVIKQTDGCVFNDNLYVITPEKGLLLYNTESNEWKTDLKPFPNNEVPRAAAVVTYKDKIWVISGADVEDKTAVRIYSPEKDEWTEGPAFSKPAFWADGCEVNGRLYVFGGATLDKVHDRFVFWNTIYKLK